MKKIFSFLLAFAFTFAPGMVFATSHGGAESTEQLPTGYTNPNQLIGLIETITNWIFAIFVLVAVIMVILAAFQFVTGGPDKATEARTKLIFAVIGVTIALLAQGVVPVIRNILGV